VPVVGDVRQVETGHFLPRCLVEQLGDGGSHPARLEGDGVRDLHEVRVVRLPLSVPFRGLTEREAAAAARAGRLG
jgi:hypothetical protein